MKDAAISHADLVDVIRTAIERVAPDVDASTIPVDVDFREDAGLDSMDFLAVLAAVHDRTGVEVPEADYSSILTIDGFAAYLAAHA
jgi:acyl carrier protein